jgi:hypothetical protein
LNLDDVVVKNEVSWIRNNNVINEPDASSRRCRHRYINLLICYRYLMLCCFVNYEFILCNFVNYEFEIYFMCFNIFVILLFCNFFGIVKFEFKYFFQI